MQMSCSPLKWVRSSASRRTPERQLTGRIRWATGSAPQGLGGRCGSQLTAPYQAEKARAHRNVRPGFFVSGLYDVGCAERCTGSRWLGLRSFSLRARGSPRKLGKPYGNRSAEASQGRTDDAVRGPSKPAWQGEEPLQQMRRQLRLRRVPSPTRERDRVRGVTPAQRTCPAPFRILPG
jgi:hypothetical protein